MNSKAILFLLGVIIYILLVELVRKRSHLSEEFFRKSVHLGVGVITIFAPFWIPHKNFLMAVGIVFALLDYLAIRFHLLRGMHGHRKTYGTVFFPLTFVLLVWVFWELNRGFISYGMALLTLADGLAAILGESLRKKHTYRGLSDQKSIEGSLIVLLISFLITWIFLLRLDSPLYWNAKLELAFMTAMLAVSMEGLSTHGSDNLTLPLIPTGVLYLVLNSGRNYPASDLLFVAALLMLDIFSFRKKWLNLEGILATNSLAIIIFLFGGWKPLIPMVWFFISSNLLSVIRLRISPLRNDIVEKGEQRDAFQVFANGLLPAVFVVIAYQFSLDWFRIVFASAIGAATADTWSTEMGLMSSSKPRHILNGAILEKGMSGGVTLAGLVGGIAGGITIFLLCGLLKYIPMGLMEGILITIGSMAGTIVDSILGATFQVGYRCRICDQYTEKKVHCSQETSLVRGWKWMNNDMVNFLSPALVSIGIIIVHTLI